MIRSRAIGGRAAADRVLGALLSQPIRVGIGEGRPEDDLIDDDDAVAAFDSDLRLARKVRRRGPPVGRGPAVGLAGNLRFRGTSLQARPLSHTCNKGRLSLRARPLCEGGGGQWLKDLL